MFEKWETIFLPYLQERCRFDIHKGGENNEQIRKCHHY